MKNAKILGLLAVIVSAQTALAGNALASPTVTSPSGTEYLGPFHASSGGHVVLDNPIAKIECSSTINGHITVNFTPAAGPVTTLSFGPCTNSWHVTVAAAGSIAVEAGGLVTSTGATIEATRFGVTCRYSTLATWLGTLTDSTDTGGQGTLDIQTAIPFHSGSVLCGSGPTTWTGAYDLSKPTSLHLD